MTLEQAQADFSSIAAALEEEYPGQQQRVGGDGSPWTRPIWVPPGPSFSSSWPAWGWFSSLPARTWPT